MIAQDVIDRIRPLINDTVAQYRWSDDDLIDKLNDGLEELWKTRPVAFYESAIVLTHFTDLTAVGDTMPVGNSYRQALAFFVAFLAYSEDRDDLANAQNAQKFFDLYQRELQ